MTPDLVAIVAELARLTIQLVGRPDGDRDHSEATITRRDLCLLCDTVIALSAPPPELAEIERLVSALVDKTWWCAQAGKSEVDAAKAECNAARAALLAALGANLPAKETP